jgi:hypothetical protein
MRHGGDTLLPENTSISLHQLRRTPQHSALESMCGPRDCAATMPRYFTTALRVLQIRSVEPIGEPVVDLTEDPSFFASPPPFVEQSGKTRRSVEIESFALKAGG